MPAANVGVVRYKGDPDWGCCHGGLFSKVA